MTIIKNVLLAASLLAVTGLAACGDDRPVVTERTTTTTSGPQQPVPMPSQSTTTTTTTQRQVP